MSIILALPAQKQVLNAYTLFVGQSPSAADFSAHVAFITANGPDAYNAFLNSVAKDIPVATLASNMLTNLGLTGVFTQAEAVTYLTSNSSNLGGAMTAVATATLNYVSDATFANNDLMVAASAAYVTTASNSLTYSTTATNTSAGSLTATTAAVTGESFTLTTGVDAAPTGAKTVNAIIDQVTAANTTWQLSDTVAPTAATLNLSLLAANAGAIAGYTTTGVTTMNVKTIDSVGTAAAHSLDVAGFTGLTNLNMANSAVVGTTADTLTVTSLAATTALGIDTNGSAHNLTVTGADWTGAADAQAIAVTGRSGAVLLGTGIETLTLTGGAAARLASLTSQTTATNKTVTVTGSDMRIDAVMDATITSLDASEATGTVNLTMANALLATATGGTGTADVLTLDGMSTAMTTTGFETLVANAGAAYVLTNATGATTFSAANATATTATITGAAAEVTNLGLIGAVTAAAGQTYGNANFSLTTATGIADTLNLAINNAGTATTGTLTAGTITANAIEDLTITAADFTTVALTGITQTATGTGKVTITAAATASNLGLGAVNISGSLATAVNLIDLSAVTGTTTMVLTDTMNTTYTGGTGVDTVTAGVVGAALTQTYNTGTGNDVVRLVATNTSGTFAIDAGAGDDTIHLDGSVATANTFNIVGGAGTGDTVRVNAGTSFIDSMSGIEKLVNVGAVTTTIAASTTAANNSVEITQIGAATTAFTSAGTTSIAGVTAVGTLAAANLTYTGTAASNVMTGSSTVGTTFVGGAAADTMTGGTAADIFTGAAGADTFTGGGTTANTFVFAAGATGTPSATNFDEILDFDVVATNVISFGAQLVLGSTATEAGGSAGIGSADGVAATFDAADNTLALKIIAVEAALSGNTDTNLELAIFVDAGNTYVFVADGNAGLDTNDVLIKLTGVDGTATGFDVATLAGQTLTIA